MATSTRTLKPRKAPVQARSIHTVEAIFEASIQVLLAGGLARLTTTRVAERAGVSVGTLYQYFPNKQALMAGVLEKHLLSVVEAVEAACAMNKGAASKDMAEAVVAAFMKAKFEHVDASRALYAVAAEVGGEAVVVRLTQRVQLALCDMLASASDRRFDDLVSVSFVLSTALVGPVQGLLTIQAPAALVQAVQAQLLTMAQAYLAQAGEIRSLLR